MAIKLILGGIKTGKTTYAQELAKELKKSRGLDIKYIATSKILDSEMEERVLHHRATRPANWETIEEPYDITKIIDNYQKSFVYILDCLTMLLTNHFMKDDQYIKKNIIDTLKKDFSEIKAFSLESNSDIIIISNQVEVGLISPYKLGRDFQDSAGLLHQYIASISDEVIIMNAGIPVKIK